MFFFNANNFDNKKELVELCFCKPRHHTARDDHLPLCLSFNKKKESEEAIKKAAKEERTTSKRRRKRSEQRMREFFFSHQPKEYLTETDFVAL